MTGTGPLHIGIDIGTSGVRAVAMTADFRIHAQAQSRLSAHSANYRDTAAWRAAFDAVLDDILQQVDRTCVVAIAIDGTSGTVLAVDARGVPQADPLMYNDPVTDDDILQRIARHAPETSAAHGATSGLAKALYFQRITKATHILHQADWLAGHLTGRYDLTDENNALKTGYDPVARHWPDWITETGAELARLPKVLPAGAPMARVSAAAAATYGLPRDCQVIAGTTDGCASFLATGASNCGDAVTALGSTLTIKILADRPLFAPEYGLYSHRIGEMWLAGGASNTGGTVLAAFFSDDQIATLTPKMDPEMQTGLDFYPLLKPGERFPINDPKFLPRMEPRPHDPGLFLQALFEGIAGVEALAYQRLAELGAPRLTSVRSVGGGAKNAVWSTIRAKRLGVPFLPVESEEAAAGSARLAITGAAKVQTGMPERLTALREISDRFDAFLVDQFGVLRDGKGPYPQAVASLQSLKEQGKTIIILSNSGKRAQDNDRRLEKLGFDRSSWDAFLTSGEVAYHLMQSGGIVPPAARRVLLISRDGDISAIGGLGLVQVERGEDADIILISASEGDIFPLSYYEALLAPAARRNIPCLCTNPDMIMLTQTGQAFGAGRIAQLYLSLGGQVRWIGKPHADIYETALQRLPGVARDRILCIGDSVEHDIAGAKAAGLKSLLVTTGILEHMEDVQRHALYCEHQAVPDFILPSFVW